MDIASLLIGAGIYAAGLGTGIALHYRVGNAEEGKRGIATCDCGHSLACHSPEQKKCNVAVEVDKFNTTDGRKLGKEWKRCACLQYVGPTPSGDYFVIGSNDKAT